MGDDESRFLFATTSGYGFIGKLGDTISRNKRGKAVLSVPADSNVLPPQRINQPETDLVIAIGSDGKLLAFPAKELPELTKGKGNKILAIPKATGKDRVQLQSIRIMGPKNTLKIVSGKRHTTLRYKDIEEYIGAVSYTHLTLPTKRIV